MRKIIMSILIIFISTLCLTHNIYAEETDSSETQTEDLKIVEADGEALLGEDTTKAQARATARNNARRNALEQAVGVRLHGSSVLYNSNLISDLVITATKGLIVKEEILEDKPRIKGDQIFYYYKLKAYVKPISIEKRGNFAILKAEVLRADKTKAAKLPVFQHNDEIQVRVKVNEDSYINIFSVSQDGMITKLYPNNYFKSEVITANKTFIFPDDTMRALGLRLRVKTPRKLSKAVESVLVIATKEKVDFFSDKDIEEPTITDLMRELSALDPSLWAEKTVGYEVRR
jgi:hypothetical protein